MENVVIDLSEKDSGAAFYALYASLRLFKSIKSRQHKDKPTMSMAGAEAFILLEELSLSHPEEYKEAKEEYEESFLAYEEVFVESI